jgi:hypothetical protein
MSTYDEFDKPLENAIREMRRLMSLPENIRKSSWLDMTISELLQQIDNHVTRLEEASNLGRSSIARLEAANVANYAWMLAERLLAMGDACSRCNGTGRNPKTGRICSKCGGTGR